MKWHEWTKGTQSMAMILFKLIIYAHVTEPFDALSSEPIPSTSSLNILSSRINDVNQWRFGKYLHRNNRQAYQNSPEANVAHCLRGPSPQREGLWFEGGWGSPLFHNSHIGITCRARIHRAFYSIRDVDRSQPWFTDAQKPGQTCKHILRGHQLMTPAPAH